MKVFLVTPSLTTGLLLIDNMFLVLGLNSVERIFIIEIMDKWIHENINILST